MLEGVLFERDNAMMLPAAALVDPLAVGVITPIAIIIGIPT
jgi:hypothetical protein